MKSPMPVLGAAAEEVTGRIDVVTLSLLGVGFKTKIELGTPVTGPVRVGLVTGFQQQAIGGGRFEVTLDLSAEGASGEESLFVATVRQGAILQVRDGEDSDLAALVREKGPGLLYPFAREVMITTIDGSLFGGFTLGVTCPEVLPAAAPA